MPKKDAPAIPMDENLIRPLLTQHRFPSNFVGFALFLIFLQLVGLAALGTQLLPLCVLTIIDVGCLFLIARFGLTDANALTIVTALAFHITVAAVIKLLIGQPLEENLFAPDTTFTVELEFFLALVAAFYVTKIGRIPNLFPNKITDPDLLRNIAIGTSFLNLAVTVLFIAQSAAANQRFGAPDVSSNPILIGIRGFGTLGLVCCTARALLISNRKKLFDPLSFIIVGSTVALGLASNSREGVAGPLITLFFTALAFGYRFRLRTIFVGLFITFVFFNYISPALIVARAERDTLGPIERTVRAFDVAVDLLFQTPRAAQYQDVLSISDQNRLGQYFGFYNSLADRIAFVQTTDLVVDGIRKNGHLDDEALPNALSQLLPGVVLSLFGYERPPPVPVGDMVAWAAGISPYGFISNLSIPGIAEAYAVGGLPAVFYRTFFVYAVCYAVIYLCGGADLRSNILAITIFLLFLGPSSASPSSSLYYFALRIVPQFAVSFFIIVRVASLFIRSKAAGAVPQN